jgi:hypothetical protein
MIRDEIAGGKTKMKIIIPNPIVKENLRGGGGVTNWYLSMVTTLSLFGLMDELHKSHIKGKHPTLLPS